MDKNSFALTLPSCLRISILRFMAIAILSVAIFNHGYAQNVTIQTVAGTGQIEFNGDSQPAILANVAAPSGLAFSANGDLYISSAAQNRVRRVNPDGIITTVAGIGSVGFSGDSGVATAAQLNRPEGISIAPNGDLYIADTFNSRIRRVDASGVITTFAGTGGIGFSGEGGQAIDANLNRPHGVFAAADGNIYISDTLNHRIRRVDANGVITTIAGNGIEGFSGDGGPATSASLRNPMGVSVQADGSLYIVDTDNHAIRYVDPSGVISTVAGSGVAGFQGDNGPATSARLRSPRGIAVDNSGFLLITDSGNHVIRMVDQVGMIRAYAGTGIKGFYGDGQRPSIAELDSPGVLLVDVNNDVYFSDAGNHRVRWIDRPPFVSVNAGDDQSVILGQAVIVEGQAMGGSGDYTVDWFVASGPNLDLSQFSDPNQFISIFSPTHAGEYILGFRVDDGINPAVSDSVRIKAMGPLRVSTGPDQITMMFSEILLDGGVSGGDFDNYTFNWTVLSGPNNSPSQFSSISVAKPEFSPLAAGLYVLQLAVNDGVQPIASDTVNILVFNVSTVHSIIITDTVNDFDDVSNQTVYNPASDQSLVIRWVLDNRQISRADIREIHVLTRVNQSGGYQLLGRAARVTDTFLEWRREAPQFIEPNFRDGPLPGNSYQFQVLIFT